MSRTTADTLEQPFALTGRLADRTRWRPDRCPVAASLDVVGSRSAMLIMREALYGTTRFDDFVDRVGITESVAAGRLRDLTELGLLARVPYREPGQRVRHEYRLTERGADFAPVVFALFEWGAKHLSSDRRSPLAFAHRAADGPPECGATVHARLMCTSGHEVRPGEVTVGRRR